MKLKNYIQDLIDKGEVEVVFAKLNNSNNKLKMYQEPFPRHGKNKGSSSHSVPYDYTNNITGFDSLVGRIEPADIHVNTITIEGVDPASKPYRPKVTI